MRQYRVVSKNTELPPGAYFFAMPEYPIEDGTLVLFSIGEQYGDNLLVGRWFSNIDGADWIMQPSRLIRVTRDIILWIVGRIVPLCLEPCYN